MQKTILAVVILAFTLHPPLPAQTSPNGTPNAPAGMVLIKGGTFTSIEELGKWLSAQPTNTADKPYTVTLNVSDLTGIANTLNTNHTKYISLDLSGNTFTSIGHKTFFDCTSLIEVSLPVNVKTIGEHAFDSCNKLTGITIPAGVTSIGERAFRQCASLTSVIIPANVTSIGEGAFRSCNKLISITIPNSVTSIGRSAFADCSSLTSVTLPTSVTRIMTWTFSYCDNLSSITIPASVTSIGDYAFFGCVSLPNITLPASVTSIGEWAFFGCASLTSVTFTGTIDSRNLGVGHDKYNESYSAFDGDLYEKFYATNKTNGTPGTYTTTAPVGKDSIWTKKP
jgi:hypothetical protein